jgi:hypothetical protein
MNSREQSFQRLNFCLALALARRQQVALYQKCHPISYTEFAIDIVQVDFYGALREPQFVGYGFVS